MTDNMDFRYVDEAMKAISDNMSEHDIRVVAAFLEASSQPRLRMRRCDPAAKAQG